MLPLARIDDWWVRVFDFPRLQIAAVAAAVLLLTLLVRDEPAAVQDAWLAALGASALYQVYRMRPYTRLHTRQVQDSRREDPGARVAVLCANVLMTNRNADALRRLVDENDPDLILLAEADDWWRQAMAHLESSHPYAVLRPQDNTYGMLLYSRLELVDPQVKFLVEDDVPSIHARVRLRGGALFELRCLHPRPPAPGESRSATDRDAELLLVGREVESLGAPAVVCGDLNDVAWSRTSELFRATSGLLDPRIGRGFFPTFNSKWPLIRYPLDHVFHSPHFRLVTFRRLPHWGSDHFPVYIQLSYEPEAQATQEAPQASPDEREEAVEKIDKAR